MSAALKLEVGMRQKLPISNRNTQIFDHNLTGVSEFVLKRASTKAGCHTSLRALSSSISVWNRLCCAVTVRDPEDPEDSEAAASAAFCSFARFVGIVLF